jgi:endo-1,4-beta-xylanase
MVKTGSPEATAKVRAMWDENYLYVYAEVTDRKLSKVNSNTWEQDSLEIFLDQNNAKTSSYEADDCQYRINYMNEASFNGTKCTAENLKSVTKLTKKGYIVEAAIKLTDVKPANGTLIGIDFQINDDAGKGSRAGTYNWFDKTGTGYANPSVFGTAALAKKW